MKIENSEAWDFIVETNEIGEKVTLKWENAKYKTNSQLSMPGVIASETKQSNTLRNEIAAPSARNDKIDKVVGTEVPHYTNDYLFVLENVDTGERINMAEVSAYTYTADAEVRARHAVPLQTTEYGLSANQKSEDASEIDNRQSTIDNSSITHFRITATRIAPVQEIVTLSHTLQAGWNLISFPIQPELINGLSSVSVYQYENGEMEKLETRNPKSETREQELEDYTLALGKAYWIYVPSTTQIEVVGTEYQPVQNPFIINLSEGWNIIGNPYNKTISVSDLKFQISDSEDISFSDAVLQGVADNKFLYYDSDSYKITNILEPWKGYLFKVFRECRLIF